jgi:glycosyltransferase involved in cell wall biosynthesis
MEYQSWISHDVYPWKLTILNLDIGLCPVMDNPFNRTKSAIKWMEYSMIGMATVASDIPPYSPVISNEQTAMLCKENHDSWFDAIEKLVIDKQFRNKMAKTAFSEVILEHNIDSKARLWVEAYEKILRPVGV